MMLEFLLVARVFALAVAATVFWVFCLLYQYETDGDWRRNPHGVHLMVFSGGVAVILTYAFASVVGWVPRGWAPAASLLIYSAIGALGVWRIVLLLRSQREN